MKTKEELTAIIEEGSVPNNALAGEVVSFKTNKCGRVTITELRRVLEAVGVDPDEVGDMLPASAMRRALTALKDDEAVDKVEQDENKVTFQLTEKSLDEAAHRVNYGYKYQVTLDVATGTITCDESEEIAERAKTLFDDCSVHKEPRDIKGIVKRLFTKKTTRDLYSINPENGGSYFVPEKHREFTARMDAFLSELGGRLERFPVPTGTKEGDAAIRESVAQGIERWIMDLDRTVESWDVSSRNTTHEKYAEQYKEATFKAEAWSDYLGDKVESLKQRVEQSKSAMRAKIQQLAAEKEGTTTVVPESSVTTVTDTLEDGSTEERVVGIVENTPESPADAQNDSLGTVSDESDAISAPEATTSQDANMDSEQQDAAGTDSEPVCPF